MVAFPHRAWVSRNLNACSGEWKDLKFKPYNLSAAGKTENGGYLHPLMKVRTQFREVFLELGYVHICVLPSLLDMDVSPSMYFAPQPLTPYCCLPTPLPHSFEEMPTDRFVESSFWNFDTLFQPQAHPARDAHDTFFIKGMW
eukprot:SAG25_NODE_264_length_10707_cov_19.216043_12_plen_142_part_00